MWPWIKRWRDWVMTDLLPTYRIGAQPRALHFSFEKAGLVLHDQPIPWNAEAVLVEPADFTGDELYAGHFDRVFLLAGASAHRGLHLCLLQLLRARAHLQCYHHPT